MPNHSAFISELYYQSNTGINEFLEVTLKATEDPSDYTISFYTQTGTLYAGSNAADQVGGLLSLSDPNISVALNTTDPDYNVYTILANFSTWRARNGESRAVALSNNDTGEIIDAYCAGGSDLLLTEGPATGVTALSTGTAASGARSSGIAHEQRVLRRSLRTKQMLFAFVRILMSIHQKVPAILRT
jgi:hypothetical protein